jgi:transposase
LAIWYKRLEEGTFVFPTGDKQRTRVGEHGLVIRPAVLAMLLDGIDLASVKRRKRYQRLSRPRRHDSASFRNRFTKHGA